MRSLLITIIFIGIGVAAQASNLVNGYIILPAGDTLRGQLKFGGLWAATNTIRVTFVDNAGIPKRYRAKKGEVVGYGFESLGASKDYLFFDVKPKSDSRFYERIIEGSRYTLFAVAINGVKGPVVHILTLYRLEKFNGEYLYFGNCRFCSWRKKLATFLADDPEALGALERVKLFNLHQYLISISK